MNDKRLLKRKVLEPAKRGIIPKYKIKRAVKKVTQERKIFLESSVCPECSSDLIDGTGGDVKCTKCNYWFCY